MFYIINYSGDKMQSSHPIQRSIEIKQLVMQGDKRCYYRFRYAKFHVGIVTADAVGCNSPVRLLLELFAKP
jgi:uncharacterized Fe-S cluster-containing radical SAM superfamily protein